MIPAFIIDQIRRREIEERARRKQPQIELPIERPQPKTSPPPREIDDELERGVVVLELMNQQ